MGSDVVPKTWSHPHLREGVNCPVVSLPGLGPPTMPAPDERPSSQQRLAGDAVPAGPVQMPGAPGVLRRDDSGPWPRYADASAIGHVPVRIGVKGAWRSSSSWDPTSRASLQSSTRTTPSDAVSDATLRRER